jgi:hypothetical protein
MPEQDDLQLTGRVFASIADTESARFARELARVLAVVERDLLGLIGDIRDKKRGVVARAARLLKLRKEIRAAVTDAGYSGLVTRASIDAVSAMADAATGSRLIAAAAQLGAVSPARLHALASLMRADLLGLGDVLAQQLWRASMTSIYTATPHDKIVSALAKVFDRTRAQVQTLFDTQVSVVGRQIVADDRARDPAQAYLYVGPIDGVVREWCLDHLGKVYTRDRIEAMDNGQLPNPFLTAGGYNCRHSWLSVSEPELIALANTGERAPGFDERVAVAEAVKKTRRGGRFEVAA